MLKTIVLKNFASRKKHKLGGTISLNRGYGRYLIKQGYVLPETYKNKEIANKLLLEEQRKKESKITNAHMIKTNLEKENISFIITNCNGNGILFGAISVKDIVRKLNTINEKLYGSIKAHEVRLKKAIKTHGIYICEIFLYDDIHAYVNIYVGNSNENISKMINQQKKLQDNENIKSEEKNKVEDINKND